MAAEKRRSLRCAIYTRKSSEEGLEQTFNSLDAQREACLSYIQSQKHEGWKALSVTYDDGGYSGGTLQRPALTKLLEDIAAGKVDLVVVYKVDRLTRSLSDFARIVEAFDAKGASFVSVTQSFNTSTSMGRLTLNVLLSFAQFEREVTGERIRDKIAASKKKGMWMGGQVPLGYDLKDRKLLVNPAEAEVVRGIFSRYLELKCVRSLKAELDRRGLRSKVRVSRDGNQSGGQSFGRGALYRILRNPIYLGEVRHREASYAGEHGAIVTREVWDAAQEVLAENLRRRDRGEGLKSPSLLAGLVVDEHGGRLVPSHTKRHQRRYRYYTLRTREGTSKGGLSIPAHDLEVAVGTRLKAFLSCPREVLTAVGDLQGGQTQVLRTAKEVIETWEEGTPSARRDLLGGLLHQVVVSPTGLRIQVKAEALRSRLGLADLPQGDAPAFLTLEAESRLKRGGRGLRFVIPGPGGAWGAVHLDRPLIRTLARARAWSELLLSGQVRTREAIAKMHGITAQQVARLLPCAWLAPDIVEAILEGRQPKGLTVKRLLEGFPLEWSEQRRVLGFAPRA
ncbi:MAG TPA: recombinase family protein [Holophagaceae bacterium]|nr:recombinase family protein [Holophagaceae bacterium]